MDRDRYKWDGDSRDERESEFVETGFQTTTAGSLPSGWAQQRTLRKRRARFAGLLWPLLIAVGLSTLALYGLVRHLHG